MAKKNKIETELKQAETNQNGEKINVVESEIKKESRGVKKGIKRGAYKKHKNFRDSLIVEQPNETITETITETTPTETETIPETTPETINNIGDEKYNKFLAEYGTPNETTETITETPKDTKTEEAEKTQNPSYDFTNNNINNGSNDLGKLRQNNAMLVNGYMLLALCDFVIPNVILKIYSFIDVRASKIKVSNTKLDKDQKEALMESANICAQYIFQKVNPLVIFFVGMSVMYTTNIQSELEKIPNVKKKIKVKPKKENEE